MLYTNFYKAEFYLGPLLKVFGLACVTQTMLKLYNFSFFLALDVSTVKRSSSGAVLVSGSDHFPDETCYVS
jgi:hypothetical protein